MSIEFAMFFFQKYGSLAKGETIFYLQTLGCIDMSTVDNF